MAKKKVSVLATEIKELIEQDKLIIGTDLTLKNLKMNKIKKVFLTSNVDESVAEKIKHYCSINEVEYVEIPQTNEDLGVMCKKPFNISILSVKE